MREEKISVPLPISERSKFKSIILLVKLSKPLFKIYDHNGREKQGRKPQFIVTLYSLLHCFFQSIIYKIPFSPALSKKLSLSLLPRAQACALLCSFMPGCQGHDALQFIVLDPPFCNHNSSTLQLTASHSSSCSLHFVHHSNASLYHNLCHTFNCMGRLPYMPPICHNHH